MGKLSDAAIRGKLARGRHPDGDGLYLLVGPTGAKSFIYRFRLDGAERNMGLGAYPAVSLAKARIEAGRARAIRALGKDPIRERDQERQDARLEAARAVTFEQAAKQFIAARESGWKNPKHRQQWPDSMRDYVYPIIGKLPVAAVDDRAVLDVLQQEVEADTAADGREVYPAGKFWFARAYTANRVRGRIEAILDWAKVNRYRQGDNPARWKGNLEYALQKAARPEHHPALPFDEIGAFLKSLKERNGAAVQALEFLIMTAARTNEVLGAKWAEFDEDVTVWTVPADRMKAKREHRVPLSAAARAVLLAAKAKARGEYVFPSSRAAKPMSNMALLALLRRMKRTDITPHGMRSCFRDWAAECTNFPNEVAEMALAHTIPSSAEAAYRRGDLFEKRRALMEAWAAHCDGRAPDNVLSFAGRAA
jgi:integrase